MFLNLARLNRGFRLRFGLRFWVRRRLWLREVLDGQFLPGIVRQRGMFSFTGLTKDQVGALRERYSIYLVGSGRINVASLNEDNMDRVCEAVAAVLKD